MRYLAIAVGIAITLLGATTVVAPAILMAFAESLLTPVGLYVVAGGRVAIGIIIVLAADVSRAPIALRVLGVFFLIAGIATPFFGVERSRAMFEWLAGQSEWPMRAMAGVAVVIGVSLIYSLLPRRMPAHNGKE